MPIAPTTANTSGIAVQIGQNGPYIFVVKKDSTLDLRQVKPGQQQDDGLTVIEEGVQPGETVVVRGQLQLAPGTRVIAKEENLPGEAGGEKAETVPN
jgi:multidrug efflux system membrane fusion protein